jgi:hypothetical protein
VWSSSEVAAVIKDAHEGSGNSVASKSLQSHQGIVSTINHLAQRFFWRGLEADVAKYIKSCEMCQKVNPKFIKEAPSLHPVAVPTEVMKQIGIDISCLPDSNGKRYVVVAIDYFTKWSEAKALENKSATSVASFLYEIICRFGCFSIQINDQGREFVNQVSNELHRLTGVNQRITSAYHPQVCTFSRVHLSFFCLKVLTFLRARRGRSI